MEKRRLIAIGVKGDRPPSDMLPGTCWIPLDETGGTLLFGLPERAEDDAERALRFASSKRDQKTRLSVKEIDVHLDGEQPKIDWEKEFTEDLRILREGDILVAAPLAKIYDRLFL